MNIVFLGPPGAGKGTQAELLAQSLGLAHLSTGNIFRHNLQRQTELGRIASSYIEKGDLVPDEVTVAMVRERLRQDDAGRGAIFDGFPRNLAQAEALEAMWPENGQGQPRVLLLVASKETLLDRLTGRLLCRRCAHNYHKDFNPPAVPGVCDRCGGRVEERADDSPETLHHRLEVYEAETRPVTEYYRQKGYLREIEGEGTVERVQVRVMEAVTSGERV